MNGYIITAINRVSFILQMKDLPRLALSVIYTVLKFGLAPY